LIVAVLPLVFDGALTGSSFEEASVGLAPNGTFAAEAVAEVVGRMNPVLSQRDVERIATAVVRYSAKYELDAELVTAMLVVESRARPWAHSPKGAVGLMQVMPHMMSPLGLAGNASTIESNVEAGCWILHNNIRRLGEDRGISAYFWGSEIRGLSYLEKVREARAELRRQRTS
jgi:soluble lytic murein transglycosylase-like protein